MLPSEPNQTFLLKDICCKPGKGWMWEGGIRILNSCAWLWDGCGVIEILKSLNPETTKSVFLATVYSKSSEEYLILSIQGLGPMQIARYPYGSLRFQQ